MNRELSTIVSELSEQKARAQVDLSGWDPRTRPSAAVAKREASDQATKLEAEFKSAVKELAVKVFITGSPAKSKAFAEYLDNEGALVIDGNKLYGHLAEQVEATIDPHSRSFGTHQGSQLQREYLDVAQLLNFQQVPDLPFVANDWGQTLKNKEATKELTKSLVRRALGDILNVQWLEQHIIKAALDNQIEDKWVVAVITGLGSTEINAIAGVLFPTQPALVYDADTIVDFSKARDDMSRKIVKLMTPQTQQQELENENE